MNLPLASTPLAPRDRAWAGLHLSWLYSSLEVPTPAALQQTLRQLYGLRPGHRLFRRLDLERNLWHPIRPRELNEWIERLARPLTGYSGDQVATVKAWAEAEDGDPSFRIAAGDGTIVLAADHGFGDGVANLKVERELIHAALEGRPPWALTQRPTRLPLLRAVASQMRRDPGWLGAQTAARRREGASSEGTATADTTVPGLRALTPGQSAQQIHTAKLAPAVTEAITEWRRVHAPNASRASLVFALVRASLDHSGVAISPGMTMLMDARRWLPAGAQVEGNFICALPLRPADPYNPQDYHDGIQAFVRSSEVLYATAHAAVGAAAPARLKHERAAVSGDVELIVSHTRSDRGAPELPWVGEFADRGYVTATTSHHGTPVNVCISEDGKGALMSVQYDTTAVDGDAVIEAMHRLATAPLHLLSSCVASTPQRYAS